MFLSAATSFAVSFLARLALDLFNAWRATQAAKAQGRAEAVAEGDAAALETVAEAGRVEAEAARAHAADPTDDAFDKSFMRRD